MTPEDKQLLLKDLCARLPYGVQCEVHSIMYHKTRTLLPEDYGVFQRGNCGIKPYLRPMSSMTEEEKIELCTISYAPDEMKTIEEKLYVIKTNAENAADFYNKHHLDYRGLIPIGLALEAPKGMYKED